MRTARYVALLALLSSAVVVSGCQTSSGSKEAQNRIRVTNGAYKSSDGGISGDIQSILMAGGLDVNDPSSSSRSAGAARTSPADAQAVPAIPQSTQTLVAALSGGTTTTAAAQIPAPAAAPSASGPAPALAMVEPPKPSRKKVVFETRIEKEKPAVVELASINATGSSTMDDAFDPLPSPEVTQKIPTKRSASPKQPKAAIPQPAVPRVKRF